MNYEEANKENSKRWEEQATSVFPNMFLDLTSLKLKRIISDAQKKGDINNHESSEIKDGNYYLIGYNGGWRIGTAKRTHRNTVWEFYSGWVTLCLGWLDFLFEIEGLTDYDPCPLGFVEPEDEEEY